MITIKAEKNNLYDYDFGLQTEEPEPAAIIFENYVYVDWQGNKHKVLFHSTSDNHQIASNVAGGRSGRGQESRHSPIMSPLTIEVPTELVNEPKKSMKSSLVCL